jgi:cell division control protein 6
MLGIISVTERNEGRRGGTYREYALDMGIGLILSAMEDTVELVGVHDSISDRFGTAPAPDAANVSEPSTDDGPKLDEF